ncbi:hypothetical protein EOPP23_06255 [Endozoicomonas sp. OPT23]|uniref:helix-turn-helix domain-containing protein n=1 Tax=Endozoicomonas sp. OPT23 TaxID=2072845 RepID=UPI00129A76CD|nr:helix-turn-helix domain-containing protein [Endozoicomonas sp. OPT23]MRI32588.1 hypothetical protein [Endozoicomonas sp. OPT23]
MSDTLREAQTITAAQHLFLYFSGKLSSESLISSFTPLFQDGGSKQPRQHKNEMDLFNGVLSAMQAERLVNEWSHVFYSAEKVSAEQASQFLKQSFDSIESDREFLSYLNISDRAICTKGSWSDYTVLRPHQKAGWTLHLTLAGSGHYNCIRTELETGPGDILLFSPTAYIHKHRAEHCDEWSYSYTKFQPSELTLDLLNWPEIASGIYLIKAGNRREIDSVAGIMDLIADQGWAPGDAEVKVRASLVEALLNRCNQIMESNGYQKTDSRIVAAVRFIEDNLYSDLSIDKIAEAACLSSSALSKLFKKYYQVGVMQWREEKRIAAACHKLTKTDKQVALIADRLGYSNQMYFSRCFKKHMKLSPSEYRKRYSNQ